jgi:hypothetical protein
MHKAMPRAKSRTALDFFRWSVEKGSRWATGFGYEPLPTAVANGLRRYWTRTFEVGTRNQ